MDERTPTQSLDRATGFSVDARTPMQSPNRAAAATQREYELQLLREAVQWLEQGPTFNKQIQERPEEKCTLNREIQDLKDMLEVKERRLNDLQNGMENLQEQLRGQGEADGQPEGRIKSLQADTSDTDSALTRNKGFQDDQENGEELVASKDYAGEDEGGAQDGPGGDCRQTRGPKHGLVAGEGGLKAQLLGLMKELEENQQVAQQLSFNVGPQPQPIETRFQEREEREHLIRKRNWLDVEKLRLDTDCMALQFLEHGASKNIGAN
ncbi:unnamed protein product [Arctogadus glacialis]